jgi:type II restriction/modification system DNA methylase subunit YeeA
MNTKHLKAYAPKARRQFIDAVTKRAAHLGIYQHKVEPVQFEGGAALIEGRVFSRKQGEQRQQLEKRVAAKGYEVFLREMAYTWFNRLAAIRYMEIHEYLEHGFRVLSHPTNPDSLPEILGHASDVADSLELDKSHIIELQLAGDKEEELYRELLLGQCHHLFKIMPFMFEQLDDATELLLPDNLTKTDSILRDLVNDIPEEDWSQIEVIGWLYQFYISEHKDAVIGKVVKSEDIPAATQLFTPNWIVKYLVQNSLGRQWLSTYPDSKLKGKMEYYIEPAEQSPEVIEQLKDITPNSIDPEQIKVLDPAAGSGHILVEVYEVLREIYLERGYRLREIPELILTKNIYGLDIDDRAAQLAGFALMMKAREDDRRIFQRVQDGDVALNVYSLQSTEGLDVPKLWSALDLEDKHQKGTTGGLFDDFDQRDTFEYQADAEVAESAIPAQAGIYSQYYQLLQTLKSAFLQAKTLGSLIQIDKQHLVNLLALKELVQAKQQSSDPAAKQSSIELMPIVNQAISLAQQYDVVIANPPYMGSKYQTPEVKKFLKEKFNGAETDLFSSFIARNILFTEKYGYLGYMTPFVWMFLSSYKSLRENLLNENLLTSLVQLEYSGFEGATVPICAFTIKKGKHNNYTSSFIRLSEFKGAASQAPKTLEAIRNKNCGWFYTTQPELLKLIPDKPITYWASNTTIKAFNDFQCLGDVAEPKAGLTTGDNTKFQRYWYEVSCSKLGLYINTREDALNSSLKWFPCNSGGEYRKWFGNNFTVVNWENNGDSIINFADENGRLKASPRSMNKYFLEGVTWSKISSGKFSARYFPNGFIFDDTGQSIFPKDLDAIELIAILCSKPTEHFLSLISQTLSFNKGDIARVPSVDKVPKHIYDNAKLLIELAMKDWALLENSYDFEHNPLVEQTSLLIEESFRSLLNQYNDKCEEFKKREETNNEFFISSLGFQNELKPEVKLKDLSLNMNFAFKNGKENSEKRARTALITDLLSYSVANMMGRYSLDREGLVYGLSGNEGFKQLATEGAYQTFPADDDGIIPLACEDWLFDDDATSRLREFVTTVWGAEHLNENLEFVAESLCLHAIKPKKGEGAMDTIRRYFSSQFFKDHCKTYKKRPIYWLFNSGKEKAFECLVYLHRYNESTLSRMRTEYVTPLMGKYDHQHSSLDKDILEGSTEQKRLAEKALKDLEKKQAELRTFDEQLKYYAEMRISLDLDDGVKVNYGKFGNLLADVKNIHGKAVK